LDTSLFAQAIIHSILEALPISSTWHLEYFFHLSSASVKILQLGLLPALLSIMMINWRILPKNVFLIGSALFPTVFIYILEHEGYIQYASFSAQATHRLIGVLLIVISYRQMTAHHIKTLNDHHLLIMMGMIQPLALLIPGLSRLGTTFLPGLLFKLNFKRTMCLSFYLQLLLITADTVRHWAANVFCPLEFYLICSLSFVVALRILLYWEWVGLMLCGFYRIGISFFI
jgi:undecaprenyl pyrophosphate phosphatase UppP